MPDVYQLADVFKARLLRNERQVASEMVRRYLKVWKGIRAEADSLLAAIERLPVDQQTPAMLLHLERLRALGTQIRAEVGSYGQWAQAQIERQQAWAVSRGLEDAQALMRQAMVDTAGQTIGASYQFHGLNAGAVARMVATLQDESPLLRLLNGLGVRASANVQDALVNGVARGWNAAKTAAAIRDASGETLTRSLRIARTETMRAYREATRDTFTANKDVVTKWEWHSARSFRTCAACWSMDGRQFPIDQPMQEHVQGRCFQLPVIDRTRLGLPPGSSPKREDAAAAFGNLKPEHQRAILGATKFDAWSRGDLALRDIAGIKADPTWGPSVYIRTLSELGLKD